MRRMTAGWVMKLITRIVSYWSEKRGPLHTIDTSATADVVFRVSEAERRRNGGQHDE